MANINIRPSVLALLVVGHISIIGKLIGSETVQGLGFLTTASPLPLVFSKFRGVEGFASKFFVDFNHDGKNKSLEITPEVYEALRGPYNRRNAYGASIAGAPMLTGETEHPMVTSIHKFGFCKGGLKAEFGVPQEVSEMLIRVESQTAGSDKIWTFPVSCDDQ